MNVKGIIRENRNQYIDLILEAVILTVSFWFVYKCDRIIIIDDEFGYWGVAAKLVGMDWSSLMSVTNYYSFGYAVLLIPLLLLNKFGIEMSVIYKVALILNGCMLAISYVVIQKTIKKIFGEKSDEWFERICAFFIVFTVGNTTRVLQAWPEIFIFFIFWIIAFFVSDVINNPNDTKAAIMTVILSVYLFAVHMRTVGILISVLVVLILVYIDNRKSVNKKRVLLVLGALLGCLVLFFICKNYVSTNIYGTFDNSNDISHRATQVKSIIGKTEMVDFAFSCLGKIFYSNVEFWGIMIIGMVYSVYEILPIFQRKKDVNRSEVYIWVFAILAVLSEIGICAVAQFPKYASNNGASIVNDGFVYGRYQSFAIGLVLVGGIYVIWNALRKYMWIGVTLSEALALVLQKWVNLVTYNENDARYSIRITAAPMLAFWGIDELPFKKAFIYISIMMIVFIFVLVIAQKNRKVLVVGFLSISLISAIWGINAGKDYAIAKANVKLKTVDTIKTIIDEAVDKEIYWAYDNTPSENTDVKILQWELGNIPIKFIDVDDIESLDKSAIILSDTENKIVGDKLERKKVLKYSSGTIDLYADTLSSITDGFENVCNEMKAYVVPNSTSIELSQIVTEASFTKVNGKLYQNWDYIEGYLTEGMKVKLDEGEYEFAMSLKTRDVLGDNLGYITVGTVVGNDVKVQNTILIDKDMIKNNGICDVRIPIVIDHISEPYIGLYTYGNSSIILEEMSYSKVCNIVR